MPNVGKYRKRLTTVRRYRIIPTSSPCTTLPNGANGATLRTSFMKKGR